MKLIKHIFNSINLIDKVLIIFMFILMIQSAFNLFEKTANVPIINSIDVVIRTSCASVFGYLLSSNFNLSNNSTAKENKPKKAQIYVAAFIGLLSIFILVLYRFIAVYVDVGLLNNVNIPTISQFRDFLSGCIGFLIGSKNEK